MREVTAEQFADIYENTEFHHVTMEQEGPKTFTTKLWRRGAVVLVVKKDNHRHRFFAEDRA